MIDRLAPPRYERALSPDFKTDLEGPLDWIRRLPWVAPRDEPWALDLQLRRDDQLFLYNGTARPLQVQRKGDTIVFEAHETFAGRDRPDWMKKAHVIEGSAKLEGTCRDYLAGAIQAGHAAKRVQEGGLQNKLAHQLGRAWSRGKWLVIDRELVLGFESPKHRKDVMKEIRDWGTSEPPDKCELDFLALGPDGELGVIELKSGGRLDLQAAGRQVTIYRDLIAHAVKLSHGVPGFLSDLHDLVTQKVRLGILPDEARRRLKQCDGARVEAVVIFQSRGGGEKPVPRIEGVRFSRAKETRDGVILDE